MFPENPKGCATALSRWRGDSVLVLLGRERRKAAGSRERRTTDGASTTAIILLRYRAEEEALTVTPSEHSTSAAVASHMRHSGYSRRVLYCPSIIS